MASMDPDDTDIIIIIMFDFPKVGFMSRLRNETYNTTTNIVAIFYPFSQFCEIDSSLLSLQKQSNTAPNLFQRGVEYGKYVSEGVPLVMNARSQMLVGSQGAYI